MVVRAVTATSVAESNVENCQQFSLPGAANQSTDHQPPISAGNDVTTTSPEPHTESEVPEQHSWNVDELIEAQKKDLTIGFIIRQLSGNSTKPVWKEVELLSDSADLSESAAAVAQDAVPVTPSPQPSAQLSKSLREPTAVDAGSEVEVESDPPEVERTRQKRARRSPADPRVVDAGSGILPDMNSSKVRPTRPKRVRFAPRYMNEYYLS